MEPSPEKSYYSLEEVRKLTHHSVQKLAELISSGFIRAKPIGQRFAGRPLRYRIGYRSVRRLLNYVSAKRAADILEINQQTIGKLLEYPKIKESWKAKRIGGIWFIPLGALKKFFSRELYLVPLSVAYRKLRKAGFPISSAGFYYHVQHLDELVGKDWMFEFFGEKVYESGCPLSMLQYTLFGLLGREGKSCIHYR